MKHLIPLLLLFIACNKKLDQIKEIDVQGHRGCRGLMPENTLEGFIKAVELGVNTLELDVVISKDHQVVVSHEAFFNHEITSLPNAQYLNKANEKDFNLYKMLYKDIKDIDVGLKPHPRFPQQTKITCHKPLLSEVIEKCDALTKNKIRYNIEIKRKSDSDGIYNPPIDTFIDLVFSVIKKHNIESRVTIQSFDHETIVKVHKKHPDIKTVILIEDINTADSHLKKIGFTPFGYSPYYKLVNEDLVSFCNKKQMKLIPWTVNDSVSITSLLQLNVDGIISDYPDVVLKIIAEKRKQ